MKKSARRVLKSFPEINGLVFGSCIGFGHFSHVYDGTYFGQPVAIKIIERGSEAITELEIELLMALKGSPNTIQLIQRFEEENTILVFEFINSVPMENLFTHNSHSRFRRILRGLLTAVASAHSKGIVHRDIKLGNIMIMPHFSNVKLIDWGCGVRVSSDMSPKAGSRTCRSPEMLLGEKNYGFGCDTWAVGIFILFVLSRGNIPWKANSTNDLLVKMSNYFGLTPFKNLAKKYRLEIPPEVETMMSPSPIYKISDIYHSSMTWLITPDLTSLMMELLQFDPRRRISAAKALEHPYFTAPSESK